MQSVDAHITSHWSRVNSDQLTIVENDNSCVTYMLNALDESDKMVCVYAVTKLLHTMRMDKPRSVKDIKFGYCGEMLTVEGTVEAHTRIIRVFKSKYILLRLEKGQVVLVFTYDLIRLPRNVPWESFPQLKIDFVDYVCLSQDQLNDLNMQKLPFFKRDQSLLAVRDCRKFSSLSHEDDHQEYMENLFKKLPSGIVVWFHNNVAVVFDLNAGCLSDNFNADNLFDEIRFLRKISFAARTKPKPKAAMAMSKEEEALASERAAAAMAELLAEEDTARAKPGLRKGRSSGKAKSG